MNRLEIKLNLNDATPFEKAYANPSGDTLSQVKKNQQNAELVTYVCSRDGLALKSVSEKLKTESLCEIAVAQNGLALQYVPEKHITRSLCRKAVAHNGLALEYVPEDMRTAELCETAVSYYAVKPRKQPYESKEHFQERYEKEAAMQKLQGCKLWERNFSGTFIPKSYKRVAYPIFHVPKQYRTEELLMKAIEYSPYCLRDIPDEELNEAMVKAAIDGSGLALEYVPERFITQKLVDSALSNTLLAIRYAPEKYVNSEICTRVFSKFPNLVSFFPDQYVTLDMCIEIVKNGKFFVDSFDMPFSEEVDDIDDLYERGVGYSRYTSAKYVFFADFPEEMRNNKQLLEVIIEKNEDFLGSLLRWNKDFCELAKREEIKKNKKGIVVVPLKKEAAGFVGKMFSKSGRFISRPSSDGQCVAGDKLALYLGKKKDYIMPLPKASPDCVPVLYESDKPVLREYTGDDEDGRKIYYISDIHIEHQLGGELAKRAGGKSSGEVYRSFVSLLKQKVDEMLHGVDMKEDDILLIGGDVADSVEVSEEFYKYLSSRGLTESGWLGSVISVLGNHELWDGTTCTDWKNPAFRSRTIEEIISDYKTSRTSSDRTGNVRRALLENELFVIYKNDSEKRRVISEEDILTSTKEELTEFLSKCSFIILGGLGYSGLNPYYNAELGLYRGAIKTLEEDKKRTARFRAVYDKVNACAHERKVIVLTHTQVSNWTEEGYNPNWFYINGHTHQNCIINDKDATVFSDNQIGYTPRTWKLNAFRLFCQYDPFEEYKDGIYEVSPEEYKEFNRGRGISGECNCAGKLYALKRGKIYMFLLQSSKSLCLLNGGARKTVERADVQYYYENMLLYTEEVYKAIEPYQNVLKRISDEVQKFGGIGTSHGCIVDISWFSHIYLNPFDGTITCYWATDIKSRCVFENLLELIKEREPKYLEVFLHMLEAHSIPLLEGQLAAGKHDGERVVSVPTWVFGTEIYKPSRIMKAVQYIWEKNVIRVWNEDILQNAQLKSIENNFQGSIPVLKEEE